MANRDNIDNQLLKSIDDIKQIIESDIHRLRTIVDAINTGDVHLDINDRLISNLNNIEFDNRDVDIAIEYLTLILSNIESQKINYNKQVSEELIGVLRHTLAAVKNLENVAIDIITHVSVCANHEVDATKAKELGVDIPSPDKTHKIIELLSNLLPNNKVSNGIFWVVILFSIFGLTYIYSPKTVEAFNETANTSTTAMDAIHKTKDTTTRTIKKIKDK